MAHPEPHPLAGQTLQVLVGGTHLIEFEVEDWADRVMDRPDCDQVYGRVLEAPVPMSRTFADADLQIRHA